MITKKCFQLIAIVMLALPGFIAYGQNAENPVELKKFGMGLHVEQFKLSDVNSDFRTAPTNKIVFTITPSNNFRIEPEIGFGIINDDLKDRSISIGMGGFGMFQKGKTNFYYGLKLEYAYITSEFTDWNIGDNLTEKINRFSIGPAMGAEFFLGDHFSIGGEFGISYMNLKIEDNLYGDRVKKASHITTDSGVLIRFYF